AGALAEADADVLRAGRNRCGGEQERRRRKTQPDSTRPGHHSLPAGRPNRLAISSSRLSSTDLGEAGLLSAADVRAVFDGLAPSCPPDDSFFPPDDSWPEAAGVASAAGRGEGSTFDVGLGPVSAGRSPLGRIGRRNAASSRWAMSAKLASGASGGVRATVV